MHLDTTVDVDPPVPVPTPPGVARASGRTPSPGGLPMTPVPIRPRLRPLVSAIVLRSQSDTALTGLAADGHPQAFCTIFERYERELRVHVTRIAGPSRVDDIIQQTMLSAWTALLGGANIDKLRPWLHRIAHNAATNVVTRTADSDELPTTVASPLLTGDLVHGRMAAREALTAIAALPANQRQALTLTAIDGQSARDAAAEMDLSENALRQLVYRARSTVRTAVSAITPLPLILAAAGPGTGAPAAALAPVATAGLFGAGSATAVKAVAITVLAAGALGTAAVTHHPTHERHVATLHASRRPSNATAPGTAGAPSSRTTRPIVSVHATTVVSLTAPPSRRPTTLTLSGAGQHDVSQGAHDTQSGSAGSQRTAANTTPVPHQQQDHGDSSSLDSTARVIPPAADLTDDTSSRPDPTPARDGPTGGTDTTTTADQSEP